MGLAATVRAQVDQNRAGLVVVHGDGSVVTRCVRFESDAVSGYELVEMAELDLGTAVTAMGPSVCRLDGEGCTQPDPCFCQCQASPCLYWSYWRFDEGQWTYSGIGAGSTTVHHGDVEGWVWGEGIVGQSAEVQPPVFEFGEICSAGVVEPGTGEAKDRSGGGGFRSLIFVLGAPLLLLGMWVGFRFFHQRT